MLSLDLTGAFTERDKALGENVLYYRQEFKVLRGAIQQVIELVTRSFSKTMLTGTDSKYTRIATLEDDIDNQNITVIGTSLCDLSTSYHSAHHFYNGTDIVELHLQQIAQRELTEAYNKAKKKLQFEYNLSPRGLHLVATLNNERIALHDDKGQTDPELVKDVLHNWVRSVLTKDEMKKFLKLTDANMPISCPTIDVPKLDTPSS